MNIPMLPESDDAFSSEDEVRPNRHHKRPPSQQQRQRKRMRTLSNDSAIQELGAMRNGVEHGASRFIGSASGIHFIRTVYQTLAPKSTLRRQEGLTPQDDMVPGEDDQLRDENLHTNQDARLLWRVNEISIDAPELNRPSFDQLVEWTKSYFRYWHPAFPFLHAPTVLEALENVSNLGIGALDRANRVIVRAILSVSLADARHTSGLLKPIPVALVFQSIDEVLSEIQFALSQPASLITTQAALAVQLFLISMLRFNSASRLGGLIVRMAFHLGLHRCPSRFPNFTSIEVQLRRRLFWSIYSLERLLCQSLGLPLEIRDDDIDVCYPDREIHMPHQDTSDTNSSEEAKRLMLSIYLSKHAKIRGMILELRNKSVLHRHDTANRAMRVNGELAKWSNEIHEVVEQHPSLDELSSDSSDTEKDKELLPSHQILLTISKHESTISLNRPLMTSKPRGPVFFTALQNCISASRTIISTLETFRKKYIVNANPEDNEAPAFMAWPSITWSIWMSCFVLAYAAHEGHFEVRSAIRYARKTLNVLEYLARRGTTWPESCADAVRQLISSLSERSNTKKSQPKPTSSSKRELNRGAVHLQHSTLSRPTGSNAHQLQSTTRSIDQEQLPAYLRPLDDNEMTEAYRNNNRSPKIYQYNDGSQLNDDVTGQQSIRPQNNGGHTNATTRDLALDKRTLDSIDGAAPIHSNVAAQSASPSTPQSASHASSHQPYQTQNYSGMMDDSIIGSRSDFSFTFQDQLHNDPFIAMDLPYLALENPNPLFDLGFND